ncbi:MAG: hypothetical protein HC933_10065 [Pleurocapsa sp. SU_196_0]|nr:hypothetical protein [Pleurocapsa sp. SU_196_0]
MATRIDTTISHFKDGLTSFALDKAVKNIEGWQKALDEAGKPELETVSKDLGKLKKMLEGSELDGAAIGKLLTKLGKATTKAAADAPAASAKKLKALGDLLSSAASELA